MRLSVADGTVTGLLDGSSYYFFDASAQISGLDARSDQTSWTAPLATATWPDNTWVCPVMADDAHNVYAMASNYQAGDGPVPVFLTAVDKTTGQVAWRYAPPTTQQSVATECGNVLNYSITPTQQGLLLTVFEWLGNNLNQYTGYSEMLDPATGAKLWHSNTEAQATSQGDFGLATSATTLADGSTQTTLTSIDLASGNLGATIEVITTPSGQWAPSYQILGQSGDDLVIAQQVMSIEDPPYGALRITTSILRVSSTTGASTVAPMGLSDNDFDICALATNDMLVCNRLDQPTTAFGISLVDGTTCWHQTYTDADDYESGVAPLLFGGYLYGTTSGGTFALDTQSGVVARVSLAHQLAAVNQNGAVFEVASDDGTQLWWAPALM